MNFSVFKKNSIKKSINSSKSFRTSSSAWPVSVNALPSELSSLSPRWVSRWNCVHIASLLTSRIHCWAPEGTMQTCRMIPKTTVRGRRIPRHHSCECAVYSRVMSELALVNTRICSNRNLFEYGTPTFVALSSARCSALNEPCEPDQGFIHPES